MMAAIRIVLRNGVLYWEWNICQIRTGAFSGRMNYVGRGIINRTNKTELEVPSSTVVDLFAKYKTSWGDVPVTLSAGCYNVFNRSYWALQPGQDNKLLLSSPRSFILSASFDF